VEKRSGAGGEYAAEGAQFQTPQEDSSDAYDPEFAGRGLALVNDDV
jgi:hypothetical protein